MAKNTTSQVVDRLLFSVSDGARRHIFFYSDIVEAKKSLCQIHHQWNKLIVYDLFLLDDLFFDRLYSTEISGSLNKRAYLKLVKLLTIYDLLVSDDEISSALKLEVQSKLKQLTSPTVDTSKILTVALFFQQRYGHPLQIGSRKQVLHNRRERIRLGKEFIKFYFSNIKFRSFNFDHAIF